MDLKPVVQLLLKDTIEAGSINLVDKWIHKNDDAAVFHHIIAEGLFKLVDYIEMK